MSKEKIYGYVRVSSKDQNEDRQLIAMSEMNIPPENIYVDKQSGKDFNRPMYQKMVKKFKKNDVLYIKSIDRLGRDYNEIQNQWRMLTKDKKVDIVVIDMPLLDTRKGKDLMGTFIADLVLQLLSFISEQERCTTRQRQKEGIEAARKRGVRFGRPEKELPRDYENILYLYKHKEISAKEAADRCGINVTTFYRRVKKCMEDEKNIEKIR
jgi:DNA invertase Pin-like site-specific DNA recombinase